MSKEIYISSTPHETRLAIVENDSLTEIYYERENEYTLAGSIYNGKVTRVLPGMQSSFVDVGLERDAFLYITDFMEEAPDSAEFETTSTGDGAPRTPRLEAPIEGQRLDAQRTEGRSERSGNDRSERTDRGERNSRGRRGRNDRGDRTSSVERGPAERVPMADRTSSADRPAPSEITRFAPEAPRIAPLAPEESEISADTGDGSDLGEGAPGADGSRRWRGRRGRRRGRGPGQRDESPSASMQESEPPIVSADAEEGSREDSSRDFYASDSKFDIEASGEQPTAAPIAAVPELGPDESPRGDRGGCSDQNRDRSRDRGRNDRGGRNDRAPRAPRGFVPAGDRYGADAAGEQSFEMPPGEPVILPGESLSKYRKEDAAGADKAAEKTVLTPLPSTGYTIPSGWDGGSTLPGESLSRHRRSDPAAPVRTSSRGEAQPDLRANFDSPAPPSVERADVIQDSDGPTFAETLETQPEVGFAPHPEQIPAIEISHETIAEPTSIVDEYEPEEASASYRVDPVPPSEYRQSAPVEERAEERGEEHPEERRGEAEPVEGVLPVSSTTVIASLTPELAEPTFHEPAEPQAVEATAGTSLPDHDITTLSASGEMLSEHQAIEPASVPAPRDQPEPTSPIHHETAVLSPEDLFDEHEEHADEFEDSELLATPSFAPGAGELEEELIDDDEYEIASLHARHDDEDDEVEEETLEGAADLGTMLREMSIDQITRPSEPEEEEDFEEDFIEESEQLNPHDLDAEDEEAEGSEEQARTAAATGDFSAQFREPEQNEAAAAHGPSYNERRSGRRDVRRGARDRDSRGGDSSGRPRNTGGSGDRDRGRSPGRTGRGSMQTTNLPAISELLKPGQEILVQIAKEPIAKKGARITSHIALPGRFLVFMPTVNHTGVSRKIESNGERRRLKEILLSEKGEAAGGFIVRTAASGASEEELRSDLRFLLNLWTDIKQRSEASKSPALIYHDLNLVERILRDQVTDNFSAIWVDTETEYERVLRFLQRFQPSLIRRVKLYLKETPLFEQFGITEEINKALRSKVWLKSGGSIVINQTEALVAIDINTGKFVGKTARLEDTIVKTNLDAIPEIVRQIRLRDLGGIIIIDFIDMDERKNRNKVMAALEEELKSDRAPSKVLQFNDFGLVAITRKRVKQSLERTLSTTCNVCVGTGMVKSPVSVCNDIYIELRKMYKHLDKGDVMLRVHPEVVKQLKSPGTKWLQEMEEMSSKTILVKSDPSLHPEQFDIH